MFLLALHTPHDKKDLPYERLDFGFSKNAGVSSREGQMVFGKEFEFERFLF